MEEQAMKFEEKLMTMRKRNGMSQEELADQLGVSRQAISRWELGSTLPDAPNLLKLSEKSLLSQHPDPEAEKWLPAFHSSTTSISAE